MDWLRQRPIAHRGFHSETAPENSLAAFRAAIAHNYPIELDIQPLADGELAVFHDETLERLTGRQGLIADQTLATIKQFKLLDTDETIPSLQDALALIRGQVPVLIETKNKGKVGPLETALLKQVSNYAGDVAIQAFNPYSLAWFKTQAPQLLRGQLAGNFAGEDLPWIQKVLLSNLLMNWASAPDFIAYDLKALPSLPTTLARRLGRRPLIAWTVRSLADYETAKRYADNIIFDPY
ncbi:Putative glycerophosphodiester phosphodiesterase YhdW [Halomicronema hongdechloris C2206]|uniref:Glycerophosphodiester phosphodiesterase YhdW n=1 Tax=Halomicronema hongdechloris C2206 TaxID=1641165 RepID=A0A1Z3HV97_9CYAN|nr:glycerophosphodiester phosphodiesterase family protein [Halomicronema hongdechloris]ASC74192.1 Putative glycerophosphodiester phosphodiesterase YhdW [Halomicronema hongdechloris C2206]